MITQKSSNEDELEDGIVETLLSSLRSRCVGMSNFKQIPPGFLSQNETVPTQTLTPSTCQLKGHHLWVQVIVSKIYTPSHLFIRLLHLENQLQQLSCDLNKFFMLKENMADELTVDNGYLDLTNLHVACFYSTWDRGDSECNPDLTPGWYRGIIVRVSKRGVKVFLADFGFAYTVGLHLVRLLPRQFSKLPFQAIEARLHQVSPAAFSGVYQRKCVSVLKKKIRIAAKLNPSGIFALIKDFSYPCSIELIETATNLNPDGINLNNFLLEGNFVPPVFQGAAKRSKLPTFSFFNACRDEGIDFFHKRMILQSKEIKDLTNEESAVDEEVKDIALSPKELEVVNIRKTWTERWVMDTVMEHAA